MRRIPRRASFSHSRASSARSVSKSAENSRECNAGAIHATGGSEKEFFKASKSVPQPVKPCKARTDNVFSTSVQNTRPPPKRQFFCVSRIPLQKRITFFYEIKIPQLLAGFLKGFISDVSPLVIGKRTALINFVLIPKDTYMVKKIVFFCKLYFGT